jgi:hypothetical protein
MKNNESGLGGGAVILIAVFILIFIGLSICIPIFTQDHVTLTVEKTDSYTTTSCSSDNGETSCSTTLHNLVYTNGEILQFNDCIVLWVWGSQTSYAHIKEGKTYQFKVYGFNIPWLNMYRSVISYEEKTI